MLLATTKPASKWLEVSYSAEAEIKLAHMVLYDSAVAQEAAQFIGHIKSETSLGALLEGTEAHPTPPISALTNIWEAAGSLPTVVPFVKRLQIGIELGGKQLLRDRSKLARTYLAAALGGILGFSLYVFISMRLPSFLVTTRILNSLGNGFLFGPVLGLGILFARWIPSRLKILSRPTRAAVGAIFGGGIVSLSFMLFHIFYLSAVPTGSLITLGAILLAIGFSLTNSKPYPIWLQAIGSVLTTALGLTATWMISTEF